MISSVTGNVHNLGVDSPSIEDDSINPLLDIEDNEVPDIDSNINNDNQNPVLEGNDNDENSSNQINDIDNPLSIEEDMMTLEQPDSPGPLDEDQDTNPYSDEEEDNLLDEQANTDTNDNTIEDESQNDNVNDNDNDNDNDRQPQIDHIEHSVGGSAEANFLVDDESTPADLNIAPSEDRLKNGEANSNGDNR